MGRSVTERRNRGRVPYFGGKQLKITYSPRPGASEVAPAYVLDIDELGCGLELKVLLPVGATVTAAGDFGSMLNRHASDEVQVPGRVVWCQTRGNGSYRVGLSFIGEIDWSGAGKFAPREPAILEPLEESSADFYETLQLSPNADPDTIHRVFRLMAERYHPENPQSGNQEKFDEIVKAYGVLSDPIRRASYDVKYSAVSRARWRIFDPDRALEGAALEIQKRRAVMALLYSKRVHLPHQPGMSLTELEDLLGLPREQLEFSLWFLHAQGLATRSETGRYAITPAGVLQAEMPGEGLIPAQHNGSHQAGL
jgi:curved DNA-binding protein